jgi:enediyne biosynthesis protein E4
MKFAFYSLLFTLSLFSCKEKPLFQRISVEDSGVSFANRITENDTMNILDFEYVYNGSGVGVGDFNNDGLQDLFFSGNQVANALYLNKGAFKFEDISATANIGGQGRWCAGVTVVDINNDGWLDIYLATTVKKQASERENLLYVNQGLSHGKPTFKEMAAEYGVNDNGHSENASFFDYDNDGDLDLYVLTNIIDLNPNQFREMKKDGSNPNTDRLYRCDYDEKLGHPVYTNVSKQAGILVEGYGLGLNICDINKDGFKDIYVTNDFISDDLFYINKGNGTFENKAAQLLKHTSSSAMGNDIADINNDGFLDIFAVDMLAKTNTRKKVLTGPNNYQNFKFTEEYGIHYQYMRNTLQLNNGISENENMPMFSEVSLLAGIAETDWSWTPSLADFDNDGYRDLLITNGFPKDITDRDFIAFRNESERLMDRASMLLQIPEVKISNYAFKNNGKLGFEDVTKKWGMDVPSFSNGAVYADLDNDGDLDYVVNNINDSAFVYKNNLREFDTEKKGHFLRIKCVGSAENRNGIGAVAEIQFEDGERIIHENNPYRGYLSSVEPFMHFGLGSKKIKNLKIHWQNGKMQVFDHIKIDELMVVDIKNANLTSQYESPTQTKLIEDISTASKVDFVHQEEDYVDFNVQNLIPYKLSELGPGMAVGDINGDGLDDVFVGGAKGFNGLFFLQSKNGTFAKKYLEKSPVGQKKIGEDLGALLFDVEKDGDLDLYISRGGNEGTDSDQADVLYLNDGKGNFSKSEAAIPMSNVSTSCVRAADFDKDGDLDIFVSGRNIPSQYPKFASCTLLRNDSRKAVVKFTDITQPTFKNVGLICDMLWTDFDNDGWQDIILAGEYSEPKFYKNQKGVFNPLKNTGLENKLGLWSSINGGDFDNDGDIDYLLGNLGLNTLFKGSYKEPVRLIAKDFDKNGNYDLIPFVYFDDAKGRKLVPFNGKDDVNKQLNITRQRFVLYKDFANATLETLLTEEERKDAQQLELNFNESTIVENLGNGKFSLKPLPIEAQFSPINGTLIEDFDQDGFLDVLIGGNNYGNEISIGRYDASNGWFLKGNGKCEFKTLKNTGFYVPFDAKAMVSLANPQGKICIFAAQNRADLKVFQTQVNKHTINISANTSYFEYQIKGKKAKREIYYGSSYLGQSGRFVTLPSGAKFIKAW